MDNWTAVRKYLKAMTAVVFVALAINGAASIVTARIATDTKDIGQQNRSFLRNFSEYMHCLVVPDEVRYAEVGKDAYFAECDALLFRGTGLKPPVRGVSPTTTTTTA